MTATSLTSEELERILWYQLYLSLPAEGISQSFPTDELAERRLAVVRWPAGPFCRRCCSSNIAHYVVRKKYQCRKCRYMFTVKTGTFLHGSNLTVRKWFLAAERTIACHAKGRTADLLTSHQLKDHVGLSYNVAHARRAQLKEGLIATKPGLICRSICLLNNDPPPDVVLNSPGHLSWLRERANTRAI